MPSRRPRSATRNRGSGKCLADRVENGAARQHQIGALDADTIIAGALLIAHAEQARDGRGDIGIAHPDAIDPAAIVAREVEMDPASVVTVPEVPSRCIPEIAAMLGGEGRDILRDLPHHRA